MCNETPTVESSVIIYLSEVNEFHLLAFSVLTFLQ